MLVYFSLQPLAEAAKMPRHGDGFIVVHQLGSSIVSKGRHPQFLEMKVELGHGSFNYPFGGGIKQRKSMVVLRDLPLIEHFLVGFI